MEKEEMYIHVQFVPEENTVWISEENTTGMEFPVDASSPSFKEDMIDAFKQYMEANY